MSARTSARDRSADAGNDGHPPRGGDDDPPGILALGFLQHHIGDNSLAQKNEHQRAHEFTEKRSVHSSSPPRLPSLLFRPVERACDRLFPEMIKPLALLR